MLKDPRKYVEQYLKLNNIAVNERGELKCKSGKDNKQIFDSMYLDYLAQVRAHNATQAVKVKAHRDSVETIKENIMLKALDELIGVAKLKARKDTLDALKCVKEDLQPLKQYIKALTGKEDKEDVAVMAHWLWQVKSKMLDKIPTYHIMPIFFGKQEGGKSTAVTKLIQPIENFRLNISLDQMTDDRYFKAMAENYIVVFDEMERADRTDIDSLKKQVTIDYNDYRPLGTNNVYKVKQACSFIGTTNRQVSEQIVDSTGMRRFWQMNCLDKLDWNTLSNLDYKALWKGIDENKTDGYILPHINQIRAKQETLVAKDELTAYMESRNLVSGSTQTTTVSSQELYRDYKIWAEENGFKPMNNVWFGRKFAGKGFGLSIKKLNNKTTNCFEINADNDLIFTKVYMAAVPAGTQVLNFNGQVN